MSVYQWVTGLPVVVTVDTGTGTVRFEVAVGEAADPNNDWPDGMPAAAVDLLGAAAANLGGWAVVEATVGRKSQLAGAAWFTDEETGRPVCIPGREE